MKVSDCFGNELQQGDVVCWEVGGVRMMARVEKCFLPGQLVHKDSTEIDGKLVLSIEVPLNAQMQRPTEDFILSSLIKTYDPREKGALELVS